MINEISWVKHLYSSSKKSCIKLSCQTLAVVGVAHHCNVLLCFSPPFVSSPQTHQQPHQRGIALTHTLSGSRGRRTQTHPGAFSWGRAFLHGRGGRGGERLSHKLLTLTSSTWAVQPSTARRIPVSRVREPWAGAGAGARARTWTEPTSSSQRGPPR